MALLFVIMFRCPAPLPLIRSKRYINTRIAPKPVQEEVKGEGRALHWRRSPVPFPGSNLPLSPGLFPVRGSRNLDQQVLRLAAQTVCERVQARNSDICILRDPIPNLPVRAQATLRNLFLAFSARTVQKSLPQPHLHAI